MEDMVRYADRIMIMHDGVIAMEGTPKEVFSHVERVRKLGAAVPEVTSIMDELMKRGFPAMELQVETEAAACEIANALGREEVCP
jgi:energy-coupling factor transport system ATP-binding protein